MQSLVAREGERKKRREVKLTKKEESKTIRRRQRKGKGKTENDEDGHKGCEVIKVVNVLNAVFLDVRPCSLVTSVSEEYADAIFWIQGKYRQCVPSKTW
jgi:hypothetical protein